MRLVVDAPGKVNLCLFLDGERADGRHQVLTLLESVSLRDELQIEILGEGGGDVVLCSGVEGSNIVSTALAGLRAVGWNAPKVRVEISKRVPVAAGMGGGSADAGAILRAAPRLAPVSQRAVSELATRLGADVPSQLNPGLAIGRGAGDEVERVEALVEHALVIVPADDRLSAAAVYAEADRLGLPRDSEELERLASELHAALAQPRPLPGGLLVNDLQPAAVSLCPAISDALETVIGAGADHAMVSGSGPTVFGIFWGSDCEQRANAAAASLPLPATCALPWRSSPDIHAFRHNLGSDS